jgi:YrbI family 3-deoxy-D-manno-octulosonate 8-phosphate phosphatase
MQELSLGKVVAIIPVRSGSKGIPGKNIKSMAGRPLIYYSLRAALETESIDFVAVATDSEKIASVCKSLFPHSEKLMIYHRSEESATDTASTESVMLEFAEKYSFNQLFLIQATSPLVTTNDLQSAYTKFNSGNFGGLLSVVEQSRFFWTKDDNDHGSPVNYDPQNRPRRQDFRPGFVENGSFYITTKESLLQSKCRISHPYALYPMRVETYWEIDDMDDWRIIESIIRSEKLNSPTEHLSNIKLLVMDFDGVFTDNKVIVFQDGTEAVICDRGDGMGLSMVKKLGLPLLVLSKERNNVLESRCKKLGIECVYKVDDKLTFLKNRCEEMSISLGEVAYIGNDINDIPCLEAVGLGIAVADSHKKAIDAANYITKSKGGNGALREICDLFMKEYND